MFELKNYLLPSQRLLKSLSAHQGEILWIRGKNGCGKSMLLRYICAELTGAREIARGFRQLSGHAELSSPLAAHDVAYLPQEANLTFSLPMTLHDVLQLTDVRSRASELSAAFLGGLDLNRQWNAASGGERKKILLLLAIARPNARLLVLDEPSNHLDDRAKVILGSWILSQSQNGKTVLLVSHESPSSFGIAREEVRTLDLGFERQV